MRTMMATAALTALLVCTASADAAGQTKVGVGIGAAIPAGGIGLHDTALTGSGWLARPIRGSYEWRVEIGGEHLQMPNETMFRCAAAGYYCAATLGVTYVGGGLQFEPWAAKALAPYGYLTIGLYHVTADAEVEYVREGTIQASSSWSDNAFGVAVSAGMRVKLGGRWSVRAEFRYSGFTYHPGSVNWASVVAPCLSLSARF